MTAEISTLKTCTGSEAPSRDTTYRIAGGKIGVLLIHGLCGTPVEMRFVAMASDVPDIRSIALNWLDTVAPVRIL